MYLYFRRIITSSCFSWLSVCRRFILTETEGSSQSTKEVKLKQNPLKEEKEKKKEKKEKKEQRQEEGNEGGDWEKQQWNSWWEELDHFRLPSKSLDLHAVDITSLPFISSGGFLSFSQYWQEPTQYKIINQEKQQKKEWSQDEHETLVCFLKSDVMFGNFGFIFRVYNHHVSCTGIGCNYRSSLFHLIEFYSEAGTFWSGVLFQVFTHCNGRLLIKRWSDLGQ